MKPYRPILAAWLWILVIVSLLAIAIAGADPLPAPTIAVCPDTPATPKCSTTKYVFFPLSDTTHLVVTGSNLQTAKTTPTYLTAFHQVADTALVLACLPPNALSSDSRRCLGTGGFESSVLVAKSTLTPPTPPQPAGPDYTTITGYLIEQSYDNGATWDSASTRVGYPTQPVAHCFRIAAQRADGAGPPLIACPLPK